MFGLFKRNSKEAQIKFNEGSALLRTASGGEYSGKKSDVSRGVRFIVESALDGYPAAIAEISEMIQWTSAGDHFENVNDVSKVLLSYAIKKGYKDAKLELYNLFKRLVFIPNEREVQFQLRLLTSMMQDGIADAYIEMINLIEKESHSEEHLTTKVFQLSEKAAELGSAEGMYRLACGHLWGSGTEQDTFLALEWLKKASAKSHGKAMFELGRYYNHYYSTLNYVVEKNEDEALRWFMLSAESNAASARDAATILFKRNDKRFIDFAKIAALYGSEEGLILFVDHADCTEENEKLKLSLLVKYSDLLESHFISDADSNRLGLAKESLAKKFDATSAEIRAISERMKIALEKKLGQNIYDKFSDVVEENISSDELNTIIEKYNTSSLPSF